MIFLGHKNSKDNSEQLLKDHLYGVSLLAEKFASDFGEGYVGKIVGLYHDIGKYSEEFQEYIRGVQKIRVDHSTAGALELYNSKELSCLIAAFCIAGHHGGLMNVGHPKFPDETTFFARLKKYVSNYDAYKTEIEIPRDNNKSLLLQRIGQKDYFASMFYTRMIFSCLVDADFLDTEEFMLKGKINRGVFSKIETLKKILYGYIEKTFFNENNVRYDEPINQRRRKILNECVINGDNTNSNLLRLTIPTGGGKTISSMAFALHNAVKNKRKRIIYVIPYTSIIEQTAKIFADIFGKENVIEHHSEANYEDKEEEENIKRLATENWDAPIIVTTNVQFFESLFSNRTSKCRKLHNIANSVIIFDEAQMIPTEF